MNASKIRLTDIHTSYAACADALDAIETDPVNMEGTNGHGMKLTDDASRKVDMIVRIMKRLAAR